MVVKYLFLFLSLFVFCSCVEGPSKTTFEKERDKCIYSALKKFTSTMEAKGFYAAGIGEGLDHSTGKQNYIGVTFDIERLPNVDFARKVEVEALQEFLKYIDAEEGIQDYVAEYPYPLKCVRIAFLSQNSENGLFSVSNFKDEIIYRKDDQYEPIGPSVEIHRESYEDALHILAQQKMKTD